MHVSSFLLAIRTSGERQRDGGRGGGQPLKVSVGFFSVHKHSSFLNTGGVTEHCGSAVPENWSPLPRQGCGEMGELVWGLHVVRRGNSEKKKKWSRLYGRLLSLNSFLHRSGGAAEEETHGKAACRNWQLAATHRRFCRRFQWETGCARL